jgi:ribosomal protein S18 acetylase RimI-like enzyme
VSKRQTVKGLFEAGEVVQSGRVQLSALTAEGAAGRFGWLEAALAPEWTTADFQKNVDAGRGVLVSDADSEPIGAAVVLLGVPDGASASVPLIAIDPQRRFRGLGGEAGLALEQHLRSQLGVERVYAPVPEARGLAVYFWLRLGYRPLSAGEMPGPPAGLDGSPMAGIWMVRETVNGC